MRVALRFVGAELFNNRTADSVKYRMRNISSVLMKDGCGTVAIFSPANRVGKNVSARIKGIARQHPLYDLVRKPARRSSPGASGKQAEARARTQVSALLDALGRAESQPGIGHNQPPEPITHEGIPDLDELKRTVQELLHTIQQKGLSKVASEKKEIAGVKEQRGALIRSGIKMATWLGGRATKIVDALLLSYVAYITGLMPHLANAISAVGHWLTLL